MTELEWNDCTEASRMPAAISRTIYDDRSFEDMPILADAMEEAGCDDDAMLKHCREPGPHVRGCWVIDLLLGQN